MIISRRLKSDLVIYHQVFDGLENKLFCSAKLKNGGRKFGLLPFVAAYRRTGDQYGYLRRIGRLLDLQHLV